MVLAGCASANTPITNENTNIVTTNDGNSTITGVPAPETKELGVGKMLVYDFGDLKLHAYETKDPIADENFLLETSDELIIIELIGFKNNIEELQNYIEENRLIMLLLPTIPQVVMHIQKHKCMRQRAWEKLDWLLDL